MRAYAKENHQEVPRLQQEINVMGRPVSGVKAVQIVGVRGEEEIDYLYMVDTEGRIWKEEWALHDKSPYWERIEWAFMERDRR